MAVYLVECVCDEEYGCKEAEILFESEEQAIEYVNMHQSYFNPWYSDTPIPYYSYRKMEIN